MDQYQQFWQLQLARATARLALYKDHGDQARAAVLKFPDNPVLEECITVHELLVESAEGQIDVASHELAALRRNA